MTGRHGAVRGGGGNEGGGREVEAESPGIIIIHPDNHTLSRNNFVLRDLRHLQMIRQRMCDRDGGEGEVIQPSAAGGPRHHRAAAGEATESKLKLAQVARVGCAVELGAAQCRRLCPPDAVAV